MTSANPPLMGVPPETKMFAVIAMLIITKWRNNFSQINLFVSHWNRAIFRTMRLSRTLLSSLPHSLARIVQFGKTPYVSPATLDILWTAPTPVYSQPNVQLSCLIVEPVPPNAQNASQVTPSFLLRKFVFQTTLFANQAFLNWILRATFVLRITIKAPLGLASIALPLKWSIRMIVFHVQFKTAATV